MESNLGSKWAFLKLRQPREGKSTGYKITRMRRSRIQAESESEMPSLSSSSFLPSPFRLLSSRRPPPPPCSSAAIASSKRRPNRIRASMSGPPSPVAEFPYLPPSHRDLMLDLRSAVEDRLGPHLLPSVVPPDVLSFHSPSGASRGALDIRSGGRDSPVDFILESWLHCELPTGALNITTLFAFLDAATDAPHLLMEFIQSSPSSLILFTDLLPRKDLVLHPDYLDEFYQQTNLDKPRQELAKLPQVQPYCSSSLYIRSVLSPTAIAVCINCGEDGQSVMEDIMRGRLDAICKEVVRIWLDTCASSSKQLGETERADLLRRDGLIKNKTIEIDLAANLPRMFSPDVANRVVGEIQKAFKI